jgi:hypothetical protein
MLNFYFLAKALHFLVKFLPFNKTFLLLAKTLNLSWLNFYPLTKPFYFWLKLYILSEPIPSNLDVWCIDECTFFVPSLSPSQHPNLISFCFKPPTLDLISPTLVTFRLPTYAPKGLLSTLLLTYLPTHLTYLLTHPHTYQSIHILTYPFTYLSTYTLSLHQGNANDGQ